MTARHAVFAGHDQRFKFMHNSTFFIWSCVFTRSGKYIFSQAKEFFLNARMLLAKFRGIGFALLLLVGLWVLFLVSAHLLLDFEQSKRYIPDVLHFQGSSTLSSMFDLEDNHLEAEGKV